MFIIWTYDYVVTLGDCGPWWCTFVEQRISGSNVFCSGSASEYAMQFRRRMTSIMHHSIIVMRDSWLLLLLLLLLLLEFRVNYFVVIFFSTILK